MSTHFGTAGFAANGRAVIAVYPKWTEVANRCQDSCGGVEPDVASW